MFEIVNTFFKLNFLVIVVLILPLINLLSAQAPVAYPLHVGDYWQYSANIEKEITKDTVMANGLTYAKMVSTGINLISFQRYSSDSVFYFYNDQDALFYDFSRLPGDTVSTIITGSDTLDIILTWADSTVVFGRKRRQWRFFSNLRHVLDDEAAHWITDSLGLTHWENIFFSYNLQGAIINGDTIGIITSIKKYNEPIPLEFRLFQNYPNPFNANTQIRFVIPKASFVILKIYNVLGEEVTTLVSERLNPVTYTWNWEARDLASGVYYYYFVADDFREVKKMVLMK
jgi:hypothetical protein